MKKIILFIALFLCVTNLVLAQRTITGTVYDEAKDILVGASVIVEGTSIGDVTDINGHYSIVVPKDKTTLVFSFVGYTTKQVKIGNKNTIDLIFDPPTTLQEVVITSYGVERRKEVTGSVSTVTSKDFTRSTRTHWHRKIQSQR
jgi:TonB-dependent starch-binding outer membrane protein SusC